MIKRLAVSNQTERESPDFTLPEVSRVVAPIKLANSRRMRSEELLAGQQELLIAHGEEEYRLKLTKQGKLIVTK